MALKRKRIDDGQARAARPAELPGVEPELAVAVPRPMVWAVREWAHQSITDRMRELLVGGTAARAWVTHHATETDREGTDHLLMYCFETEGRLVHGSWMGGFDDYHLWVGFNHYASWMTTHLCPGGTFTVLHMPGAPDDHDIYGNMELYIEQSMVEVVRSMRRARDPERVEHLARRIASALVFALSFERGRTDEIKDALRALGLMSGRTLGRYPETVQRVVDRLGSGPIDSEALGALSDICHRSTPGRWAAD